MIQGITVALMGLFLLTAPSYAQSGDIAGTARVLPPSISYHVTLTGYNAVPSQTDGSPLETASGAYSNPEVVAARSPDLAKKLPFGTVISIDAASSSLPLCGYSLVQKHIGLRVIADTMNPKMHNKVDVLFGTEDRVKLGGKMFNAARVLGVCSGVTIRVVGHINVNDMPKTQSQLIADLGGQQMLAISR